MACCDLPEDLRKVGIHRLQGCTTLQAMDTDAVCGSQWHFSNYGGITLVDLNHQDESYRGENIKDSTAKKMRTPLVLRIVK